jgi:ferritin-like metal-binding protein YciE
MSMNSLEGLFLNELRDLYNAETQLVKALPKMAKKATSPELKDAFETHLEETKNHVSRLEEIFGQMGEKPTGKTCKAMQGLVAEGQEVIDEDGDDHVIDAALIGAAQRVEHYEMAGYGTARTFADLLGEDDAADLLQETLDEEGETNKKLTDLAESVVNPEAEEAEGGRQSSKKRAMSR